MGPSFKDYFLYILTCEYPPDFLHILLSDCYLNGKKMEDV